MRSIFYICVLLISFTVSAQQQFYYYYKGQKKNLYINKQKLNLFVKDDFKVADINAYNLKSFIVHSENSTGVNRKYANVSFKNIPNNSKEYLRKVEQLSNHPKIIKAQPNFFTEDNVEIGMSNYFYVSLKKRDDYELLKKLALENKVQIIEEIPNLPLCYILLCTDNSVGSTLDIANKFYESDLFKYSVPDFLANDVLCSSDLMFNQLWGLHNSNNPNLDINICDAWNISEGAGVKIAVLDTGIQKIIST